MADEKDQDGTPNKVYLKLRDRGSVFHDPTQGRSIAGEEVNAFLESARVVKAIRGGHVLKVTEKEYDEYKASQTALQKKASDDAEKQRTPAPGEAPRVEAGETPVDPAKRATPDEDDEATDKEKGQQPPPPGGGRGTRR